MNMMFTEYEARVTVDRLVGGVPANEKMMKGWLDARAEKMDRLKVPAGMASAGVEAVPTTFVEVVADQNEMREELDPMETHGVVFYRDKQGRPCLEGRCVKAALREAANILGSTVKRQGILEIVNLKSKLNERVFVRPKAIPFTAEIQSAERPISAMTPQGKRTSIKVYEYAEDVSLVIPVSVLNDKIVTEEILRALLEYMCVGGMGSDRSQGNGTFTLESFKQIG